MRRMLALLPIVAWALLARTVAGDEPKTYALPEEVWKAGDVATRTESKHKVQKLVIKGPDGAVNEEKTQDERVEFTMVMKVTEANGEGEFTKALIYFSKWSKKEGDAEDISLSGKHVEFTSAGPTRDARIVGGGKVSDAAAAWLKEHFSKGEKNKGARAALAPDRPLAVGGTWTPDFATIEKAFGGDGRLKFVREQSNMTGTLLAVDGDLATIRIDVDLQAGPMDGPTGPMEWKEGGKISVKAEGTTALTATSHNSSAKMSLKFKGTMEAGPLTVLTEMSGDNSMDTKSGGEMPPLPEAK